MFLTISQKSQTNARAGFTLIEILIAITLVAIMALVVAPNFIGTLAANKKKATKASISGLNKVIQQYNLDTGEYPTKLRDLIKKPADVSDWGGPYLTKTPRDGWNKPFVYKLTPEGKHPYELYSYGSEKGRATPKEQWISVWDL